MGKMKIRCLICNDILVSTTSYSFIECKCGACHIDNIGNNLTRISGDFNKIVAIKDDGTEEKLFSKLFDKYKK